MKRFQLPLALIVLFMCLIAIDVMAGPPKSYPIPPDTDRSLFYLQRSSNSNTVVYDANMLPNGRLNHKEPIDIYWMRYNSTGERKALNFVERKFAYGLSFDRVNDNTYMIHLSAYSERDIKVTTNSEGKAVALITIDGQPAQLKSIYIDISGSGFWTTVNTIELAGIDLKEGKIVKERFDPNEDGFF